MEIRLYKPLPNAKRIKCHIPWQMKEMREQFKLLNGAWYHPQQKLWSLANTPDNWTHLTTMFKDLSIIVQSSDKKQLPSYQLSEDGIAALTDLENKLIIKGYSQNTITNYCSKFGRFAHAFKDQKLSEVSTADIETYIIQLIKQYNISPTYQNLMINAIKAYYEMVMGRDRTMYNIPRPKKSKELPALLSQHEVRAILDAIDNKKHRTIIMTIYSCGLRISEAIQLRVQDIHSDEGYVFIKCAKGKKDRKTILSPKLLTELRDYYRKYKPSYWLFEGQKGGQYSTSSITQIFKRAKQKANITAWATVHTLRHSFATHLVQHGTNLRYIQTMLGHESPKTTEIYTRTIQINSQSVQSPLDFL